MGGVLVAAGALVGVSVGLAWDGSVRRIVSEGLLVLAALVLVLSVLGVYP